MVLGVAPTIAPLRSDDEPHFKSTAALIAWPYCAYAVVVGPASRYMASGLHSAESPREFLRRCQDRCDQRDLAMASDIVASASSVASAYAVNASVGRPAPLCPTRLGPCCPPQCIVARGPRCPISARNSGKNGCSVMRVRFNTRNNRVGNRSRKQLL
jgi:hypothetical protein